jgi:hypothetical protein
MAGACSTRGERKGILKFYIYMAGRKGREFFRPASSKWTDNININVSQRNGG